MANLNQGTRSGNAFGRLQGVAFDNDDGSSALKPGYLLRIRDAYCLVTGVEAMALDLFFTDTLNVGIASVSGSLATDFNGTHGEALEQYGFGSVSSYYDLGTGTVSAADKTGNILAPDYDSGFVKFTDLSPNKGNLYHLCPCLPSQPKFMTEGGEWHSRNAFTPFDTSNGGLPIGFRGDGTAEHLLNIGTVSGKLQVRQPAGVSKHQLDRADADGESPQTTVNETSLAGVSGFIDGQLSPVENPNWAYGFMVEHGEETLPVFRYINDSDEYLVDGRIRLVGYKYKVLELSQEQLSTLKTRAGGRLRFMYYNPVSYQSSGFLSEYLSM